MVNSRPHLFYNVRITATIICMAVQAKERPQSVYILKCLLCEEYNSLAISGFKTPS